MIVVFGYLTKDVDQFSIALESRTGKMSISHERKMLRLGKGRSKYLDSLTLIYHECLFYIYIIYIYHNIYDIL